MKINRIIGCWLPALLFLCVSASYASDLKLSGGTSLVTANDETAYLNCEVSWNNAWRNAWNYDAVYLFAKYKVEGQPGWHHLMLAAEGNTVETAGYTCWCTSEGHGIFVYPEQQMDGLAQVKLRIAVQLKGNNRSILTPALIEAGKVQISLQGIEMVYVPTAPFYAGDGLAQHAFSSPHLGIIPPAYDIIGTNSTFTYTAYNYSTYAVRAADRVNNSQYSAQHPNAWVGSVPTWWMVDFKTPKKILYFGVSSLGNQNARPGTTWFLEASKDNANWTVVWSGGPEYWSVSSISYPVQQAIKVTQPDSCRYYRIRVTDVDPTRAPYWSDVYLTNVAMTETDLEQIGKGPVMIGEENGIGTTAYPSGYRGFFAMKYEISQEQYVTFLNQLSYAGQQKHTLDGLLGGLKPGDYIFGDNRHAPNARNGIVLLYRREGLDEPVVFGHNLNPADSINSLNDGQAVACNFLSPADGLAYADWAGLRPLTELEYEKMCRKPYPAEPMAGEYAWGNRSMLKGSGLGDAGKVTESFAGGNANLDRAAEGPVRTGAFVRGGQDRVACGISWWGIEELSGNLAEIYYNADVYGRDFSGQPGTGELTTGGQTNMPVQDWPYRPEALILRGGSFASPVQEAKVSDRSRLKSCFSNMNERLPDVGMRLGYSGPQDRLESLLTLENGQTAAAGFIYDTICSDAAYHIRGNIPGDSHEPRVFSWYKSMDGGETYELISNACVADLQIRNMTTEVERGTTRQYRYKRCVSTPGAIGVSAVVVLTVGNGYEADRLRDTIRPCMASRTKGITLSMPLPTTFEWRCPDHNKLLIPVSETAVSSRYVPTIKDLKAGERPEQEYTLDVKMTVAGRCELHEQFHIDILRETETPFPTGNENFSFGEDDTYEVTHVWNGTDSWTWSLVGETGGIRIDPHTGVLSGATDTMCLITVMLRCDELPDVSWKKQMKEIRLFAFTGTAQQVVLIPGGYQLECWGARGGNGYGNANPIGYGGYTKGEFDALSPQLLYLYVGEEGLGMNTATAFNGGGAAFLTSGHNGGRGGGASDIRLINGGWDDFESLKSRIMVAAGGGGAMPSCGGNRATAGHGGGLTGNYSINQAGNYANNRANGGSQTAGGTYVIGNNGSGNPGENGSFGTGAYAKTCAAGGGGGYYGGASQFTSGGGGGSSFISGYPGCDAIDNSGIHTGQPIHYSGITFKVPQMTAGQNNGPGQIKITVK